MEYDVIDGLKEINYPLDEAGLKTAVAEGPLTKEFTLCVEWLTKELQYFCKLDEHVNAISSPDDVQSFLLEVSSFLKELGCEYRSLTEGNVSDRLNSTNDRLKLLDFLITELLAARILSAKKPSTNVELCIDESPTAATLRKLLMALGFPRPPATITANMMFAKVKAKLEEISNKCVSPPLFKGILSPKQWEAMEKIQKELHEEYRVRRELLLKRLDVTIQSFQWSERMKGRENEIASMYLSKRDALTTTPEVKLSDVLAARYSLAIMEKTSNANVRKNTQSSVNKVIIGRVPDRGGRPSEQQPPPPEMPNWAPRAAQPQGGGGGGGGGRGGFHGGDRGGRVQGGWNSTGDQYQGGGGGGHHGGGGGGGYHQGGGGGGGGGGYHQGGGGGGGGYHQGGGGGGGYHQGGGGGGGYHQGGGGGGGYHQGGGGRGGRGGRRNY